jgi:hypothetical protein
MHNNIYSNHILLKPVFGVEYVLWSAFLLYFDNIPFVKITAGIIFSLNYLHISFISDTKSMA